MVEWAIVTPAVWVRLMPKFPPVVLRPKETYQRTTIYKFSAQ